MSENVIVEQGEHNGQETAILLLAAAEELDLPAGVVRVDTIGSDGARFSAPEEVVKKAGLKVAVDEDEEVSDRLTGPTADFFAENEGEFKPEQKVASDNTPIQTNDPALGYHPVGDGQNGEAEPTQRAAAKKTTAAKKTAAKKATAKNAQE